MSSRPPGWPEFLLVWGGAAGLLLTFLESSSVSWFPLPGWWYRERYLLVLLCLGAMGLGIYRWANTSAAKKFWSPSKSGRRFRQIIVYSKENCPLCDDAVELLQDFARFYRELSVVDISQSPELFDVYKDSIPVVEIDGKIRFKGRIHPLLLKRLIEGSPLLRASHR